MLNNASYVKTQMHVKQPFVNQHRNDTLKEAPVMHKYVTNSWTMELLVCYIFNKHHQTEGLGGCRWKRMATVWERNESQLWSGHRLCCQHAGVFLYE